MRVRIDDRVLLSELVASLRVRPDVIVEQQGEVELELSLVGSYSDRARRLELERRLRVWEATQPGVRIDVVDGPGEPVRGRGRPRALGLAAAD